MLQERAREVVGRLGYTARPLDSYSWLDRDYDPMLYLAQRLDSRKWRQEMRAWGPRVEFDYRQSPRWLVPGDATDRIDFDDPPMLYSGMIALALSGDGALRFFRAVPPEFDTTGVIAASPDWNRFFTEAGLDRSRFTRCSRNGCRNRRSTPMRNGLAPRHGRRRSRCA